MPRPNRTDRRLHWQIETFKISVAILVVVAGGLVALLSRDTWGPREGYLMVSGLIGGGIILVVALFLAYVVILSIRKLPDE